MSIPNLDKYTKIKNLTRKTLAHRILFMEIIQTTTQQKETVLQNCKILETKYFYASQDDIVTNPDTHHRLIDFFNLEEKLPLFLAQNECQNKTIKNAIFMSGGYESWAPGWELLPGDTYPKYFHHIIPAIRNYIEMPQTHKTEKVQLGQFISYLRWENTYFVIASLGKGLPPVQYHFNSQANTIACEIYATGKEWQDSELMAHLAFFCAKDYFELQAILKELYYDSRFESLQFLDAKHKEEQRPFMAGGWESWYNHYNKIDHTIIEKELLNLETPETILKQYFLAQNKQLVFQIDDGWQEGLGQWNINKKRFPHGLQCLVQKAEEKNYIPGLWLAPFIVDIRTDFAKQHKDWILKDKKGKPIPAGFNAAWGNPPKHNYFCLDLSIPEVLSHLETVMNTAINEWGFRFLKLDFLFAGMLTGNFKNKGAAYQHYTKAMSILTAIKTTKDGKPVAYLGCGIPFENSYQYFPLSRIGADTMEQWDRQDLKLLNFSGRPGVYISLKDTLGRSFWREAVFYNDPDVCFFRNNNCTLSETEKETDALVNFLFANQIMISDDPSNFNHSTDFSLSKKIADLFKLLEKEFFGNQLICWDVYRIFNKDGTIEGIVNLSDAEFQYKDFKVVPSHGTKLWRKNENGEITYLND